MCRIENKLELRLKLMVNQKYALIKMVFEVYSKFEF